MKILNIYEIKETDYKYKNELMEYNGDCIEYFPIYGNQIFKPISKTKICATPLFAYSEVFWSYYIQKYFESDAPRYFLAKCKNIQEDMPKYCEEGTLVFNVLKNDEKLVDLLEYFKQNPDPLININDYKNSHNILYSYKEILETRIFQKRADLRHQLETQILLSILRKDENFHYRNVSFIVENKEIKKLCPTLDSEFSLMFMYPDKKSRKETTHYWRNEALFVPFDKSKNNTFGGSWGDGDSIFDISLNNILKIVSLDSELVIDFINKLDLFINDIESMDILFYNKGFFEILSSDAWEIGDARYNKFDENLALKKEENTRYVTLDEREFNDSLKQECLASAKELKFNLQILLILKDNDCLNDATVKKCLELKNINITKEEFNKLSIDEKINLLGEQKVKKLVND